MGLANQQLNRLIFRKTDLGDCNHNIIALKRMIQRAVILIPCLEVIPVRKKFKLEIEKIPLRR